MIAAGEATARPGLAGIVAAPGALSGVSKLARTPSSSDRPETVGQRGVDVVVEPEDVPRKHTITA